MIEEKLYVSYEDVHRLVSKIAKEIEASGWEPDHIVAIASGGFIPARILKTYLKKSIFVVGLKRYNEDGSSVPVPEKVQWIDGVDEKIKGKKILLVDEVDDTRVTLAYCLSELARHEPAELRVAVLHDKDKPKLAAYPSFVKKVYAGLRVPDYWIKYPWDALDIDEHNRECGIDTGPGAKAP
jgi:hypoxanthine phosphoribosyltransferase